ncbi:unnamed protein product [Prunus armeniaca]
MEVPHSRVDALNHNNHIPMHLGGHMLPPHMSLRPMAMGYDFPTPFFSTYTPFCFFSTF